jgi:uncharacterized membrane protein
MVISSSLLILAGVAVFILGPSTSFLFFYYLILPGFVLSFLFSLSLKERLLLSFPLGILFYIPLYILSLFFFSPVYHLIPFLMALPLARKVRLDLEIKKHVSLNFVFCLILLILTAYLVQPFNTDAFPRTDYSSHYFRGMFMKKSLSSGRVPIWMDSWCSGIPIFTFYPPVHFFKFAFISSNFLVTEPHRIFNSIIVFGFLYSVTSMYWLGKKIGLSPSASFIASFLFIISPSFMFYLTFNGNPSYCFSYLLMPIAIYSLFLLLEKRGFSSGLIFSSVLATLILTHHQSIYDFSIISAAVLLCYLLTHKHKVEVLKSFLPSLLIFAGLISFWMIPLLTFFKYTIPAVGYLLGGTLLKRLTGNTGIECGLGCQYNFGPLYLVFAILGLVLSGLVFHLRKTKVTLTFDKETVKQYFLIFLPFIFLIIVISSEQFGFQHLIPLKTRFETFKEFLFISPLISLLGAFIVNAFRKVNLGIQLIIITILAFLFSSYVQVSVWEAQNYVSERAPIDYSQFASIYDVLKAQPYARVDEIGIYGGAMIAAYPLFTDKPMLGGWYSPGSFNYNNTAKQIHGEIEHYKDSATPTLIYNTYQKTFTKYVPVFACAQDGLDSYRRGIEPLKENYEVLSFQNDCILILEVKPKPSYISKVNLFKVEGDYIDDTQRKFLFTDDGWKITSLYPRFNQKVDKIFLDGTLILGECQNSDTEFCFSFVDNKTTVEIIKKFKVTETPLEYEKTNPEMIKIKADALGWVLIKETYFPRWHAYQNNQELPIYISDMGYMLIHVGAGEVLLKNELVLIDYLGILISLLILLFIFIKDKFHLVIERE